MFIEVHIAGQLLHRWSIEDYHSVTIDGATWEQNVEAREKLAMMFFNHFLKYTAPIVAKFSNPEYFLVFESKLHNQPYGEDDDHLPPVHEI